MHALLSSRAARAIPWVPMLALAISCSGAEDTAPDAWLGEDPHLVIEGTLHGEAISFELRGDDAAIERVFCERNYVVPVVTDPATWSAGYLEKIELEWHVVIDGVERQYQVELSQHDFLGAADGASVDVVAPSEPGQRTTSSAAALLAWEWEADGTQQEDEAQAEHGVFVRGLFEHTPGEDGVVAEGGTGRIGGYLDLGWENGDRVRASFTAQCAENDLEAMP